MKVDTKYEADGKTYELLSYKMKTQKSFKHFSAPTVIEYQYIVTGENGRRIINLQEELEKLCRFGSLSRQKVIARLGHLQSEIKFVRNVEYTDIDIINEEGHEGCGFVPQSKFGGLVIFHSMGPY